MASMIEQINALEAQYKVDHNPEHFRAQFRLIDSDNDGYITKAELIVALTPEAGDSAPMAAEFVMSLADKDNDHRLDIDEFVEFSQKMIS